MLRLTLPHVDAWNTWYDGYGNSPDGFRELNRRITAACEEAGRDPGAVSRSACVLVRLGSGAGERPDTHGAPAIGGGLDELAAHLRALGEAGADEAILVVDPITEKSIRQLSAVVAAVA
jgi:alkanesulfonate monooxygenase SsuD/methylene tetrahydromethanopterin reductase-like flavin-dependent oxidoreductase (luciferase family)